MSEPDSGSVPERFAWWSVALLLPCAAVLTWLSATEPVGRVAVWAWTVAGLAWAAAVSGRAPTAAAQRGLAAGLVVSYLALLAALRANSIRIPPPQRAIEQLPPRV